MDEGDTTCHLSSMRRQGRVTSMTLKTSFQKQYTLGLVTVVACSSFTPLSARQTIETEKCPWVCDIFSIGYYVFRYLHL